MGLNDDERSKTRWHRDTGLNDDIMLCFHMVFLSLASESRKVPDEH